MLIRVTNAGKEMFINSDQIILIREVGEQSKIADALGGGITKKKAAIVLCDVGPIVVDETIDELQEILDGTKH